MIGSSRNPTSSYQMLGLFFFTIPNPNLDKRGAHQEKTSHATAPTLDRTPRAVLTVEQTTSLDKCLLCAFLPTLPLSKHWKIDSFTIQAGNGLHVGSIARCPCLPANIAYRLPRVADPDPIRGAGRRGITRSCTLPSSGSMCVLA